MLLLILAAASALAITQLSDAAQGVMQSAHIPGAQVAILRDGQTVFSDGYGFANVSKRTQVDSDTLFEIGSITKQFTAAAILQLKEQGKLALNDPLGKYIPEYAAGKDVTIEQLLGQVSGIPDYLNETRNGAHLARTTPGGLQAALDLIKDKPLDFQPGADWSYSNTNYLLLGEIVSRASGMAYEQYIRDNIFAKAGMTQSAFMRDEDGLANMATGYLVSAQGEPVTAPRIRDGWAGGAGAIVSTAADMAKWDEAFFSGKIISLQDVRLATTPGTLLNGRSTGYGFGWELSPLDGQPMTSHNGATGGFVAQNDYFPVQREAIIVLTNAKGPMQDAGTIAQKLFETLHPQIVAALNTSAGGENPAITALAREWVHLAQTGGMNKSELTQQFASFLISHPQPAFTKQMAALGDPVSFVYRGKQNHDNFTTYSYRVTFKVATLVLMITMDPAGKIAGMEFQPA